MSQPKPGGKSSIVQTLLIVSVVYLGFMLFFNRGGQPQVSAQDAKKNYEAAVKEDDNA